jgi:hypothetical protein
MNEQRVFQVSEQTRRADAAKAARANRASTKAALKSRASTLEVMAALEGFVPGVLNAEEQAWALADPEFAKFLAMCSDEELERMREERAYKEGRAA